METCRSSNSSRIYYFSLKFCACVFLAMLTKLFSALFCSFNEKSENFFFFESRRNQVFILFPWYLPSEENTIPICTCRYFQGKQMCKFLEKSKLDLSYSFQVSFLNKRPCFWKTSYLNLDTKFIVNPVLSSSKTLLQPKLHFNFCTYLKLRSGWLGCRLPLFQSL